MARRGRSSPDGGSWRLSPWGVAPDAIPGHGVNPEAVRAAAVDLAAGGVQVRDLGADVRRTWQGLAPHYEAPEAPTLFAVMEPPERTTRELGDAVEAVAAALRTYADDVEPLVARLALLRREAHLVDDVVRRVPDWREDAGLVARARRIRTEVASAVAALEEAEQRCAAAIRATYTRPPVCAPVPQGADGGESPWGPPSAVEEGCARSALGGVKSFLDGFIGDGIVGGWLATASLVGLTTRGFSRDTFHAAWGGVLDLAPPGTLNWMLRRPDVAATRDAWGGLVKGLVAADQWGDNPARAAGVVSFGVVSAVLPGGGVKAAAGGAGVAARTAGRAARVADDVAVDAGQTAAKAWPARLELGAARVPSEWGPGRPNNKGVGLRWTDPAYEGNGVRIDEGVPHSSLKSQRVDHVIVRSGGRVLGRDGKPIAGSIQKDWQAHIPLEDWLTWRKWNSPE